MADQEKFDWNTLFATDGPKIIALADDVAFAHNLEFGETVAAVFALVDQTTKKRTGQNLFVTISPGSAKRLAKLIEDHAKARGWPELPETPITHTEVKKGTH